MEIFSLMAMKAADAETGEGQQQKIAGNIYREQWRQRSSSRGNEYRGRDEMADQLTQRLGLRLF